MTTDPTLDIFLRRWRSALRDRLTIERGYWEGQKAFAELKRTGYLARVRLEEKSPWGSGLEHFIPDHDLPKICAELVFYRKYLNRVKDQIEFQKGRQEWLRGKSAAFRKQANRYENPDPSLSRDLTKIAKKIDEARRGVRFRFKARWNQPVPIFAPPIRGHDKIAQERQLDSRFQVRLAVIFRRDMPKDPIPRDKDARGPSLRTIARLIVLFLVCADLAEENQGEVRLKHNERRITVDGVLQQLRSAGIDRKD